MSPQLHRCTLCDATVQSTGRVGHLKFTSDDAHGPKQEMPPEYDDDTDEYFVPVESDSEGEDTGNSPQAGAATQNDETQSSDSTDPDVEAVENADESPDVSGLLETVRHYLLTPIDEL